MAFSKHPTKREPCSLQQECTYLTRLIQQHKNVRRREAATSIDLQTPAKRDWLNIRPHGTLNATVSKYKKVNVNTKPPAYTRRLYAGNNPLHKVTIKLASEENPVSETATVLNLHDSQSVTHPSSSGPSQRVPDSRSSRMYLNPHFFKANSSLKTGVTAEHATSESSEISKLKHSVHINPKVLAQVMKLTEQPQLTQDDLVANSCALGDKHETQFQTRELLSESSGTNFATKKYVFHSKTKLVKQNAAIQQTSTSNLVRNPGTTSDFVPKDKSSPVIKCSLSGPLMSISRTKLVRAKLRRSSQGSQGLTNNRPSVPVPNIFPMTPKALERQSMLSCSRVRNNFKSSTVAMKAAKAVCSKYKLSRVSTTKIPVTKSQYSYTANKSTSSQDSRYKIDRRLHKTPKRLKKVKKYSLQYEVLRRGGSNQCVINPKPFNNYKKVRYSFTSLKFGNKTWNNSLRPRRVTVLNKKLMRIGSSPTFGKGKEQRSNQQSSSLVRIGGVLYRTSKLKLTRSLTPKAKNQGGRSMADSNVKKPKSRSSFIVSVRGNKFLMDATGKTMLRVPETPRKSEINVSSTRNVPVKRIDIGGVTFVQKSTNVLIRTNTHNARSLLSQAKQKSIALLTSKMRKSNQPCIFYHRFGKCVRKEKGTCPHVHDPKHVVVCKKFLQGCCVVEGCTLSHDVGPEKMPTCKYFLDGCCVRDSCPYLHVKVNAKAGICKNFLRGYCPEGQKCRKRHTYLCPEFEKAGCCPKGKYCPYPHKTVVKKKPRTKKHIRATDKAQVSAKNERKRYYETGGTGLKEIGAGLEDPQVTNQVDSNDLHVKRLILLKKVDDMKRAFQNAQHQPDTQINVTSSLMPESKEPEARRPKLGWLPAYIPLGSEPL